ncbi:jg8068 [Pararge aegeria aegeria]|uniref:Jg8068 protein n=1 Tax=Pararge aegeria aegeria TaxID=348720 RepID=A0A8S4R2Z3_9NEOP|nr:jg8068 [Pararge aegeria aegeria]
MKIVDDLTQTEQLASPPRVCELKYQILGAVAFRVLARLGDLGLLIEVNKKRKSGRKSKQHKSNLHVRRLAKEVNNSSRCWNGSPVLVSAALVDPQRGGQTTLSASQVAVGSKRLRIVELGTPYKRPMSSSGRLSVDVMIQSLTLNTAW